MRTKIRKEVGGLFQDIAWLAGIVFVVLGAYYLLGFLYSLVHTIITTIIVTAGVVFVGSMLIWAITEMPLRTHSKDEKIKTKGV